MQFDRPAALALNQLGGSVELDALKAPALTGRITHGITPLGLGSL